MTGYKRIYLDTCLLVYYLSSHDRYFPYVERFLADQMLAQFYTSTLTMMEYMVYPIRHNELQKIAELQSFVDVLPIRIMPVDDKTSYKAAEIRAQYPSIKPMDAVHLATACQSDCDVFLTNDKQLRQFAEIDCLLVDDLIQMEK